MRYLFEDYALDPDRRELTRHAEAIAIGPKVFDLLLYLIQNREHVVSKDDLLEAVWSGRIVAESTLTSHINAVRKAIGDSGEEQRLVRTITRKGFRFVGEIKEASGDRASPHTGPARSEGPPAPALTLPDRPSIAALPFLNLSGDIEQEYFTDGVVEDIITALSRIRWLFVIARNSSFTYKGRAVDVRQVARELGVRYVLEGSVRKAGSRVRIGGQLIDTASGAHIWADRFDGALDDIFELQDQVASNVAGAIEPKLRQSEIERAARKPIESLDTYDLYLRALAQIHKYTEEGMREAVTLLGRALAIDPFYAPAAALLGWCRAWQRLQGWGPLSETEVAEAVRLARQALEAGKDDPDTLALAANVVTYLAGDRTTASSAIDRALMLNPNSARAWFVRGIVSYHENRPDRMIEAFSRAMRLSPFDPLGFLFASGIAIAHLIARRYEEAIEWADRSLREVPRYESALRNRVVACAQLGRIEEARDGLKRLLEITPGLTIARYKGLNDAIHPPEIIDLYIDGLRKAGLPEQ